MRLVAVGLLALLAGTQPVFADYILRGEFRAPCVDPPPMNKRAEPNVPYSIVSWPQAKIQRVCAAGRTALQPITACAIYPGSIQNKDFIIAVSSFLNPTDLACVILYEKAHLPPNSWQDQAWEDQAFKGTPYAKRLDAPAPK